MDCANLVSQDSSLADQPENAIAPLSNAAAESRYQWHFRSKSSRIEASVTSVRQDPVTSPFTRRSQTARQPCLFRELILVSKVNHDGPFRPGPLFSSRAWTLPKLMQCAAQSIDAVVRKKRRGRWYYSSNRRIETCKICSICWPSAHATRAARQIFCALSER